MPADLTSGSYFVEVRNEDDAGGIYPYSDLPFALVPTRDLAILDDDLVLENAEFHVDGGAQAPVFSSAGPVLQGERDVAFNVQPTNTGGWHADLHFEERFDFLGYSALRFALHPGDAIGQTLTLQLGGFDVRLVGRRANQRVHLNHDEWQIVEIPLDIFVRERTVPKLGFSGNLRGTFYIDDMRLVSET